MPSFGSANRRKKSRRRSWPRLLFRQAGGALPPRGAFAGDLLLHCAGRRMISTAMTDLSTPSQTSLRARAARLADRPSFQNFILGVILFNAVILGLETSDEVMAQAGPLVQ